MNNFDGRTYTLIGIVVNLCVVGKVIRLLFHPSLLQRFLACHHSLLEFLLFFLVDEAIDSVMARITLLCQLIWAVLVLDH